LIATIAFAGTKEKIGFTREVFPFPDYSSIRNGNFATPGKSSARTALAVAYPDSFAPLPGHINALKPRFLPLVGMTE
jgi:hypothetical protein